MAAVALGSNAFMITTASTGGSFTEGVLGVPRFINPILSTSEADRDLVALVYSGLLKAEPDEKFSLNLASNYSISEDATIYTVTLKDNLKWHDGHPVTSADIVYTVHQIQNDLVRSPRRANWEGVSIEAEDEKTVRLTLKQAYSPFLENLTENILPEHIWKNVTAEEFALSVNNIEAIGTGPYKIDRIKTDSTGIPTSIELVTNSSYALGEPFIERIIFKFFSNETDLIKAYENKQVDSISGLSTEASKTLQDDGVDILSVPLSRLFAIFFNQNQSIILADINVKLALSLAVNRSDVITFALSGFGSTMSFDDREQNIEEARKILDNAGWKLVSGSEVREKKGKPLSFTLATSDSPELSRAAKIISDQLKEIGVAVDVKIYEVSDLNTNVIRPRKFDALLFGEVIGHFPDLYAFWHSKQRLDPGLNIAGYTNSSVDTALEAARQTSDTRERAKFFATFEHELSRDIPAIFLYSPHYTYIPPEKVKNIKLETSGNASDRFANVYKWYISTDRVWKIFAR